MENKNLRIGDYLVSKDGRIVQIEGISDGVISCGLLASFTDKNARSPRLTKDFFAKNGFALVKDGDEQTFVLGDDNVNITAGIRPTHFFLWVKNRVFSFAGPCDDLNEFLHILDDCAIKRNFNCE